MALATSATASTSRAIRAHSYVCDHARSLARLSLDARVTGDERANPEPREVLSASASRATSCARLEKRWT